MKIIQKFLNFIVPPSKFFSEMSSILDRTNSSVESLVTPEETKEEIDLKSLDKGIVSVMLDATISGVTVPDHLRGCKRLVLNYSYRYHISDFEFDEKRVVASLSFQGVPYQCVVPWDSVLAIGGLGETVYYEFGEIQEAEASQLQEKGTTVLKKIEGMSEESPGEKRERPKLTLIRGGKS